MSLKSYIKGSAVFSAFVRRPSFLYPRLSESIRRLQSAPLIERENVASELLKKTLNRALSTPYAKLVGMPRCLSDWPLTDKATLRENGRMMKIFGVMPYLKSTSGGTTGVPIQLDLSLQAVALEQALLDYLVEPYSVDWFTSKVAVLRGDNADNSLRVEGSRWQFQNGNRRLHFYSNSINKNNITEFSKKLEEFNPDILWVYPNVLRQFLQLLGDQPHQIQPKLLFSSSEVFDDQLIRDVNKKLQGTNIVDFYGQAERSCAAYSLSDKCYHFVTAYGNVELIFERSEEDFDLYRIIATPYWNKSFGLVRLDTGDFACLPKGVSSEEVHETAMGVRPFLGIYGRKNDYLVSPTGEVLVGIDHIHKGNNSISQLQVVQKSIHEVELRVIPRDKFTKDDVDQLISQARKKIPKSISIVVSTTDTLKKSQTGKIPFVIREI